MAKQPVEMYTVAFDIPFDRISTFLPLLQGEVRNFRFFRAKEQPIDPVRSKIVGLGPGANGAYTRARDPSQFKRARGPNAGEWVMAMWPEVKALFEAGGGRLRHDNLGLQQLMPQHNKAVTTLTPMLSEFKRRGLLQNSRERGWWELA